jgi:hypothetical protein
MRLDMERRGWVAARESRGFDGRNMGQAAGFSNWHPAAGPLNEAR